MDFAGTSRTRPPTQYANTWPSSTSTTASGPFSKRGSAPSARVLAGAAFFAPGRRDVDDGLAVCAGRDPAAGAVVLAGRGWAFSSVVVMAAASEAASVDGVRASAPGTGALANVSGTAVSFAGAAVLMSAG